MEEALFEQDPQLPLKPLVHFTYFGSRAHQTEYRSWDRHDGQEQDTKESKEPVVKKDANS